MNKWILIEVENNNILEPNMFNTYEEAYAEMEKRYNNLNDDDELECHIHDDYANIQSDYDNFDWRIFEIKF